MQNQRQQIWDIPEIGHHLAQFLRVSHLAAAASVCKCWNSTFSPSLYSRLCWQGFGYAKLPPKEVIEANANNIRTLHLRGEAGDFPFEAVSHLKNLHFDSRSQDNPTWDRLLDLIRRNNRITLFELNMQYIPQKHELMQTLSSCSNLLQLKLTCRYMDLISIEHIFSTCVRLQEFYISARNSDGCGPLGSWIEFPEMRVLHFDFGQGLPLNRQLEFIQRCPKLKSLNWTTVYRLPIEDVSLVLSTYCRQLRELSFVLPILDSDIALILNSCCEITSFHDIDANFGRLAFQSLEQHFSSLTHLNVGTRSSMTSAMVQGIMSSCPSLLSLTAPFLDTLDILGNIEALSGNDGKAEITEAICSRGWVCLSLRHLEVRICGLGEEGLIERQRLILQQLAKLEKLEVLSINSIDKLGNWKNDGLDLRLKAGLDILASLRRLEKLSFMGVSQQMNEQDIQWILQAWPRLRSIQGNTHFARSRRHQLEILLEKHHIKLGKLTVLDIDDNDDDDDEDDLFFWDIVQA